MTLEAALREELERKNVGVVNARLVVLAFSTVSDDAAYVSQIEVDELLPLVEKRCRDMRAGMVVH